MSWARLFPWPKHSYLDDILHFAWARWPNGDPILPSNVGLLHGGFFLLKRCH